MNAAEAPTSTTLPMGVKLPMGVTLPTKINHNSKKNLIPAFLCLINTPICVNKQLNVFSLEFRL